MSQFILITKDAMCKDYLPTYGNKFNKTPNIDAIAEKGTIFTNYHAAAPSTVMAFYSMATGTFAHETDYEMYERIHDDVKTVSYFKILKNRGIQPHIVWGRQWMPLLDYYDYFKNDVIFHVAENIEQKVGAHFIHDGYLKQDDSVAAVSVKSISNIVRDILREDNVFIWLHLPHVINGRVSYGSDISLFDEIIGEIRRLIPDEHIAISADHGNMNGHKGKICYGYDVYECAICIPLITPRINGLSYCNTLLSSVDLFKVLIDNEIPTRQFIYSDSAYRAQKHRKIAILYDKYKYIYNKQTNTEELYDLIFDPEENFSIMHDYVYDVDRKIQAPSRELYYYPEWESLISVRDILRKEKDRIWKNGSIKYVAKSNIKDAIRPLYERFFKEKS